MSSASEALPWGAFWLATLNAVFNASAATCMLRGWMAIRSGQVELHRRWMLRAVSLSVAFLVSYAVRSVLWGDVRYAGPEALRIPYWLLLASHVLGAIAVVPLVLVTLVRGLGGRFERHRRLARWTLPLWLYVSITGVLVYGMLYGLR